MNLSKLVKLICSVLILSFAGLAWACFWDSDTLRTEAKGVPGVVEAVTGFFPVYPDEYYERRIEIAEERLVEDPNRLGSYDDIAVSLDRLGDSTAAIAAIEPKLAVVERLGDDAGDHLYRYHANLGTFHAHRWIRNGGDAEDLADLEAAREHIAKAIEINPDAHFGREFVQLGIIDWLLDPEAGNSSNSYYGTYPTILSGLTPQESEHYLDSSTNFPEGTLDGLIGIIVLGAAWESVDVFAAIGLLLLDDDHSSLATLCAARIDDLENQGKSTLRPDLYEENQSSFPGKHILASTLVEPDRVYSYYKKARVVADEYRAEYSSFIKGKLDSGMHPDTDEGFFDGEPEVHLPKLPDGYMGYGGYRAMVAQALTIFVVLVVLVVAGITWMRMRK